MKTLQMRLSQLSRLYKWNRSLKEVVELPKKEEQAQCVSIKSILKHTFKFCSFNENKGLEILCFIYYLLDYSLQILATTFLKVITKNNYHS